MEASRSMSMSMPMSMSQRKARAGSVMGIVREAEKEGRLCRVIWEDAEDQRYSTDEARSWMK